MSGKNGKILLVLTSHDQFGDTGNKTGWYLPELAHPYNYLKHHYELVVASPKGGKAPLDPYSLENFKNDPECKAFLEDPQAQHVVENTHKLSEFLGREKEFRAIFYVGGHGPLFDLYTDADSLKLAAAIYEHGGVVSAVCHGPAAILNVKLSNGEHLIRGKNLTAFSDAEEEAAGFTKAVPILVETEIKKHGANFSKASELWGAHVVTDGRLITGQNPNSATPIAKAIHTALQD